MGPGSGPQPSDEPLGALEQMPFTLQEDGKLRCPAGAYLWLSEVRQENAFTQRAVYLAYQTDCQRCSLREQCLAKGAKGDRARRVSAVRRLLPPPASVECERKPVLLGPIRWVDVAGRTLRHTWTTHWRRQHTEIIPLVENSEKVFPPPRPPRAVRSHYRWSWSDRLACNAWWGPPQLRVTVAGVPPFSPSSNTGGTSSQTGDFNQVSSPL
ncbi:transposase [Ktedonobacter sp. SOSP1-52]|uniref:transposase n=1 Tax=Ktedonobacter sp. SOSP1-52 TaxID=2778366 RepID=UPI001915E962|nr:transposase [Ktedonobacter sp. SOSP1-52]